MRARNISIAIVGVLSVAAWLVLRSMLADKQWHPLKAGGAIRVLIATNGGTQEIPTPGPPLMDRIRLAWRKRSIQPLQSSGSKFTASSGNTTQFAVWAEFRGLPEGYFFRRMTEIRDFEIQLADGRILHGRPGDWESRSFDIPLLDGQIVPGMTGGKSSSAPSSHICCLALFDQAPSRERELTLTFTLEGQRHALTFANPQLFVKRPKAPKDGGG